MRNSPHAFARFLAVNMAAAPAILALAAISVVCLASGFHIPANAIGSGAGGLNGGRLLQAVGFSFLASYVVGVAPALVHAVVMLIVAYTRAPRGLWLALLPVSGGLCAMLPFGLLGGFQGRNLTRLSDPAVLAMFGSCAGVGALLAICCAIIAARRGDLPLAPAA